MNFVDKIGYDFVREFGESLGLKDFHVRKSVEGWHINFDDDNKVKDNILVGNFIIQSGLGEDFCKKATKLWQIEMFKKFGNKYYRELKAFEYYN